MDLKCLERLGLSQAEIDVYTSLLKLGQCPASAVVKQTGLRKSTVYNCLERLVDRGLANFVVKGKLRFFEATEPERLLDYLDERKSELETIGGELGEAIGELKKLEGAVKPRAEAYVLEGVEGFKTMRRDALKHAAGEVLLIGAIARENVVMPLFFEKWNRERVRKKINLRILHKEEARGKYMTSLGRMQTRFLPPALANPVVINVYGDRVVNVLWKGNEPLCVMIANEDFAQSYRNYFKVLWKISRA